MLTPFRYLAPCLLALAVSIFPASRCVAQKPAEVANNPAKIPFELISIGGRYGTNAATDKEGAMDRLDIFWTWRTPFSWEFTPGWDIGARMNASVGALYGQHETGAMGTLVPTLAIGDTGNKFALEGGVGVALLSKWEFGGVEDFGGPLQFILDVGVNFRVAKHFGMGYRYQHWSDGGIHGDDNRGVEMHMIEFSYRY